MKQVPQGLRENLVRCQSCPATVSASESVCSAIRRKPEKEQMSNDPEPGELPVLQSPRCASCATTHE